MTRPQYCGVKEDLVSVHIQLAEHSPEWREERFCSEGEWCSYHLTSDCPLSGGNFGRVNKSVSG